jgi:hypothetical protein
LPRPSDLRRSLLTDRHARSERGVRTSRPVSSRLPLTVFTTKLQRFKVRQQRPAHDTGISRRPFTLLHRLPVSGPPAQGQRSRPATSITSSAFAPARSVSHSPLPPGFPDGGGSQRKTRCRPSRRTTLPAPSLSSPSGFSPLRIDAATGTGLRVYRDEMPDLPSLPDCVRANNCNRIIVQGPLHSARLTVP